MEYILSSERCRGQSMDLAGLFSEVVRFEIELWNAVDARLRAAHGLPLSRFEPMQVVKRTPRCRVIDIAEALSITVGGTSKLVDRLEASGLCRRRPDPDDGRSSLIALTPAGQRLLADATRTFLDELELRLGAALSPPSLERFAGDIRQLRQGLRAQEETRPA